MLPALSLSPEQALAERVGPLVYFQSRGTASSTLRKSYYECAARNLALLDALEELASVLAEKGIHPVVLKGADLATSLYPNVALRPMSDLDVWVSREEVRRAEEALASLGYRAACPEMTPGLARAIKHARVWVRGPNDSIAVDLHWSLVGHDQDERAPSLVWFREHTKRSERGPFLVLERTAHLLYLAAHMKLQHYDESPPLLWLVDFHLLSRCGYVDWDELFGAARAFGWEAALAATAAEVEARLGLALPEPLARKARPAGFRLPRRKGGVRRALNELATLDGRGRARLVSSYLFPTVEYVKWRYRPRPGWSWPLYYPLRWARGLAVGMTLALRPKVDAARPLLREPS